MSGDGRGSRACFGQRSPRLVHPHLLDPPLVFPPHQTHFEGNLWSMQVTRLRGRNAGTASHPRAPFRCIQVDTNLRQLDRTQRQTREVRRTRDCLFPCVSTMFKRERFERHSLCNPRLEAIAQSRSSRRQGFAGLLRQRSG